MLSEKAIAEKSRQGKMLTYASEFAELDYIYLSSYKYVILHTFSYPCKPVCLFTGH